MDRSDFHPPDFTAPVDAAAQKRLVPPGGTVKGMQLQALVDECTRRGHTVDKRFSSFRDYSGEVLIDLLIESAALCHPRVPPREGLRRIGHIAYPTLAQSMIGRVVFGLVGSDPRSLISLVSKGYALSNSSGQASVIEVDDKAAVFRLQGIYSFVDAWHVGIIEGGIGTMGHKCTVRIKLRSPTSADFLVEW
jgi:uncharacterized protein (TIGR02265 family)